jgi:hypothetical protein
VGVIVRLDPADLDDWIREQIALTEPVALAVGKERLCWWWDDKVFGGHVYVTDTYVVVATGPDCDPRDADLEHIAIYDRRTLRRSAGCSTMRSCRSWTPTPRPDGTHAPGRPELLPEDSARLRIRPDGVPMSGFVE